MRRSAAGWLLVAALAVALALPPAGAGAAGGEWQAQYWSNRYLSGPPALVRTETAVSFDWAFGSPGAGIPKDNWSARWVWTGAFAAGWYRFRTFTDDGVRVWVDDALLIDQWFDMPGVANVADVYLSAGTHRVKMEYYEHTGYARASLTWSRFAGEPTYQGWRGEYFNNRNLSGNPSFVRDDPKVDFDWGWENAYPGVGLGTDDFSVRWTRRMRFDAGSWRFKATVSDGIRIYVDGQKVVDAWREQDTTFVSGDVYLSAGEHEVRVEYFEGKGRAIVRVEMEYLSAPVQPSPTPGYLRWKGEYFANRWLTGAPTLVRDDAPARTTACACGWTTNLSLTAGTTRPPRPTMATSRSPTARTAYAWNTTRTRALPRLCCGGNPSRRPSSGTRNTSTTSPSRALRPGARRCRKSSLIGATAAPARACPPTDSRRATR
jgi:hypothetical protein